MLKSVQEKQRLTTGSRRWLATASHQKLYTCQACQKLKRHASWSTTGQNRTTGRSIISRLDLATQSSREPALFWKTWLFTFHSYPNINTPYTHERKRASRENFERETLEKNKIDSSTIFIKRPFKFLKLSSSSLLNPWETYYQNLFWPYPFLWGGCLVLWEVVRKEPISHWLMLWSSSGIREARKEIGSAQPRWSKKLGGLRYIG